MSDVALCTELPQLAVDPSVRLSQSGYPSQDAPTAPVCRPTGDRFRPKVAAQSCTPAQLDLVATDSNGNDAVRPDTLERFYAFNRRPVRPMVATAFTWPG